MSEIYVFKDKALEEIDAIQSEIGDIYSIINYIGNVTTPSQNSVSFSSSRTWTCPEGVTKVCALLQSGGQGGYSIGCLNGKDQSGSSADDYMQMSCSATKSGRATLVKNIKVVPGQTYDIVVGAGGTAGVADLTDATNGTIVKSPAGEMGGESSAFGYSSEDTSLTKLYQYTTSPTLKTQWLYNNGSGSSLTQYNEVTGSTSVPYYSLTDTLDLYNGANAYYNSQKAGSVNGKTYRDSQGKGASGRVMLFY